MWRNKHSSLYFCTSTALSLLRRKNVNISPFQTCKAFSRPSFLSTATRTVPSSSFFSSSSFNQEKNSQDIPSKYNLIPGSKSTDGLLYHRCNFKSTKNPGKKASSLLAALREESLVRYQKRNAEKNIPNFRPGDAIAVHMVSVCFVNVFVL